MNNLINIVLKGNYIEANFNRIKNGNRLDTRRRPFEIEYLNDMIDFYEQAEEFEKCRTIVNFKDNILDHENNYK